MSTPSRHLRGDKKRAEWIMGDGDIWEEEPSGILSEGVEVDGVNESEVVPQNPVEIESGGRTGGSTGRGHDDALKLLGLFPEEIWLQLAKQLDPSGLEDLINASPFLRHLLRDQRVIFLWPKVWEILAKKYHANADNTTPPPVEEEEEDPQGVICDACGRRRTTRWYSEILILREVCRSWRNGIDEFYYGRQAACHFGSTNDEEETFGWMTTQLYCGLNEEDATQFTNTCQQMIHHFHHNVGDTEITPRSPLFPRKLEIIINTDAGRIEDNFFPQFERLLQTYGQHIRDFNLYFNLTEEQRRCYEIVNGLLGHLPNLANLELDMHGDYIPEEVMLDLEPMPRLANLESLKVAAMDPHAFLQFVRTNSHVSWLGITSLEMYFNIRMLFNIQPTNNVDVFGITLENLREVSLTLISPEVLEALENARAVWPLEKMAIRSANASIPWSRIFNMIQNRFGDTLTDLTLCLPKTDATVGGTLLEESFSYRLSLRNLKSLKLELIAVASLDWILPVKDTLERLELISSGTVDRTSPLFKAAKRRQIIQFLGFEGRLLESNIWGLFPKLELIKERINGLVDRYCRKEWREEIGRTQRLEAEKKRHVSTQTDDEVVTPP